MKEASQTLEPCIVESERSKNAETLEESDEADLASWKKHMAGGT